MPTMLGSPSSPKPAPKDVAVVTGGWPSPVWLVCLFSAGLGVSKPNACCASIHTPAFPVASVLSSTTGSFDGRGADALDPGGPLAEIGGLALTAAVLE